MTKQEIQKDFSDELHDKFNYVSDPYKEINAVALNEFIVDYIIGQTANGAKLGYDKRLDEYGNGRNSVIDEAFIFCEKEIAKIKDVPRSEDTHANASMSGQVYAYSRIKQLLLAKKVRTLKNSPKLLRKQ